MRTRASLVCICSSFYYSCCCFFCFGASVSVKSSELLPFTVALLQLNETKCQIFPRTHAHSPHNVHHAASRWLGPSLHPQFSLTDCLFVCVCVLGRCGNSALITSRIETDRKAVGRSGHSAPIQLCAANYMHLISCLLSCCLVAVHQAPSECC